MIVQIIDFGSGANNLPLPQVMFDTAENLCI